MNESTPLRLGLPLDASDALDATIIIVGLLTSVTLAE